MHNVIPVSRLSSIVGQFETKQFCLNEASNRTKLFDCLQLMKLGQKILGRRVFAGVMKTTFYGQFVAGDKKSDISRTVNRLQKAGVGTMLYLSLESDVGEGTK